MGRADPLGQAAGRAEAELGEVRQQWGGQLISTALEVKGWLAALGRLLLWGLQVLSPVSVPKTPQEAILAP